MIGWPQIAFPCRPPPCTKIRLSSGPRPFAFEARVGQSSLILAAHVPLGVLALRRLGAQKKADPEGDRFERNRFKSSVVAGFELSAFGL